ncbi:NADH dehydrogenase subunit 5 [Tanacetum coccineum]
MKKKKREENYQLEMLEGAKLIGAGAATIASAGAAIGIGNVLSSSIHSVARNPSLAKQSFGYAILGFALTEAIASFAPMMAFLISSVFRSKNQRKKVWERSWSGKAKTAPRIWVARGRLCPDGGALWGRAQPNRDSTPPTSSAPLYRLNHSKGLIGGTGEPRELADKAAIKAMLVNRVGDFGLAPGISGCFTLFQTVDFSTIFACASVPRNSWISRNMRLNAITLICILLLIGAAGKSAQIGSHTWSPDAMEGPTPVSALIHAATMVTAGVFMIARCSPLFEYPPTALIVITFAGAMTSFLAATTGILQNDLKRVIAYSTCSQLGYMIFACGISNYSVSVFHLMNHAFFKALLFLSAGSVIHAMSDEQDMRKMGGLASSFPFTYAMMLMGSLSLIGFPCIIAYSGEDGWSYAYGVNPTTEASPQSEWGTTLLDVHGIATRRDKMLAVLMIGLAVFANVIAIYSDAYALFKKKPSPTA